MLTDTPWRNRIWFLNEFIYSGKSINELAKELDMDWSSLERLINLLRKYNPNPEPSLNNKEGAETIEITHM
ncbi:hypothetical protein ACFOU2_12990 [Bacillus songklensis]|uniref:Uncharacterized protein n=1 Tax=Bacillus songklensis TaxID=1069116 RepID=A0ABV8B4B0_9BACI